jgi:hypothetical protein
MGKWLAADNGLSKERDLIGEKGLAANNGLSTQREFNGKIVSSR